MAVFFFTPTPLGPVPSFREDVPPAQATTWSEPPKKKALVTLSASDIRYVANLSELMPLPQVEPLVSEPPKLLGWHPPIMPPRAVWNPRPRPRFRSSPSPTTR